MSNILKVFVVLNFVLSVVFVATIATLLGTADNWKLKHKTLDETSSKQIAELNDEVGNLKTSLDVQKQATQAAIDERDDGQVKNKSLTDQLVEEKSSNEKLNNNLSELRENMRTLAAALKQSQTDRETYEKRMTTAEEKARSATGAKETAEDEARRLEVTIAQQKENLDQFEMDITELRKELDHNKNLVKMAIERGFRVHDLINAPPIDAVVQKVNSELRYVMLSVGRDDKVIKGMRFILSRNGHYVGEVQVDSVYPKICSASFITPNMEVEAGDSAATRL